MSVCLAFREIVRRACLSVECCIEIRFWRKIVATLSSMLCLARYLSGILVESYGTWLLNASFTAMCMNTIKYIGNIILMPNIT